MKKNLVPDALPQGRRPGRPKITRKTRDVLEQLGCKESHLHSLLRRGRLPRPGKDASGDLAWSVTDIAAARKALAEARSPKRGK